MTIEEYLYVVRVLFLFLVRFGRLERCFGADEFQLGVVISVSVA